jgi:hypothetical protein
MSHSRDISGTEDSLSSSCDEKKRPRLLCQKDENKPDQIKEI